MKKMLGIGFAVLLCLTLNSVAYARPGDVITRGPKPQWKIEFSEEWFNPQPDAQGQYLFPLDNIFRPNQIKTLWTYVEINPSVYDSMTGVLLTIPDTRRTSLYDKDYQLADGWWVHEEQDHLVPQPQWEAWRVYNVNGLPLPPDSIRYANMASMCTPEPASMLLLGSGLIGVIGFSKKGKKEEN